MTEQPNPDMDWYVGISRARQVTPRCLFASVERCPRYFQSIALLGDAGVSTKIPPGEDERLQNRWEKSDLWPKTAEAGTSTSGDSTRTWAFSNFCPEVSYDRFHFFASRLYRYADEIDLDFAHERLGREGVPGTDWRWSWAAVSPMHFTECPLYSSLSHSGGLPELSAGAVEETHAPTGPRGPMTDAELRARLLSHFYRLRHSNGGFVPVDDVILGGIEPITRDAIGGVCRHLGEAGLIEWTGYLSQGHVIGSARITGPGIDAIERGSSANLEIRFPHKGEPMIDRSEMSDIFVSYTSKDRDWAFWIGQELKTLGHNPRIHEWEIPAGGDIPAWMEQRLQSADRVLCVVSADYLTKEYSSWERRAAQWAAAKGRPNFMLLVLVEDCEVPVTMAHIKRCVLFDLSEEKARASLSAYLAEAGPPAGPMLFPGAGTPQTEFPGGSFEEAEKKKAAEICVTLRREAEVKLGAENSARRYADDLIRWLGTKQRLDVQVRIEGTKVVLIHGKQQMSVTFTTETSCTVVGVGSFSLATDYGGAIQNVMDWVNNPSYIVRSQ